MLLSTSKLTRNESKVCDISRFPISELLCRSISKNVPVFSQFHLQYLLTRLNTRKVRDPHKANIGFASIDLSEGVVTIKGRFF